jgi:putative transposase
MGVSMSEIDMARRTFEYRIYPKRKHLSRLYAQSDLACKVYNSLLELQKVTYKETGKGLAKFTMNKGITEMKKADTTLKGAHSQVLQNCSDRLSKAFKAFFQRVKEKKSGKRVKAGYPTFKKRFHSITFPQGSFVLEGDRHLRVSKVGRVPILLHRPTIGEVRIMTIKRTRSGKWFVMFSCDVGDNKPEHPTPENAVGIDVGLESFATLSNGIVIENPRNLAKSEKRLKRLQRRVSRKKWAVAIAEGQNYWWRFSTRRLRTRERISCIS